MKSAEMLLWTIIDKEIYLERNKFYNPDISDQHVVNWYNNIQLIIDELPRTIQFWTRTGNDLFMQR